MMPPALFHFAAACQGGSFLGFPKWYKYLNCNPDNAPQINNINNVWLIGAAVIEIMIRIAALAAIAFIIWGGIQYTLSQGEPDKTNKARQTILNALIGLVLSIAATVIISFVAGRFN